MLENQNSKLASDKKKIKKLTEQLFHANTVKHTASKVHYLIRQEKSREEQELQNLWGNNEVTKQELQALKSYVEENKNQSMISTEE